MFAPGLPSHYAAINYENGHSGGCAGGAGGDCTCGKHIREARREYRKLQKASGIDRATFRFMVDGVVEAKVADGTYDAYELSCEQYPFLEAAREVSNLVASA